MIQKVHSTSLEQECYLPDIVVPDGFQVVIQLIDQGNTGRDLKAGDVCV